MKYTEVVISYEGGDYVSTSDFVKGAWLFLRTLVSLHVKNNKIVISCERIALDFVRTYGYFYCYIKKHRDNYITINVTRKE